jgi:hypothetical protein
MNHNRQQQAGLARCDRTVPRTRTPVRVPSTGCYRLLGRLASSLGSLVTFSIAPYNRINTSSYLKVATTMR